MGTPRPERRWSPWPATARLALLGALLTGCASPAGVDAGAKAEDSSDETIFTRASPGYGREEAGARGPRREAYEIEKGGVTSASDAAQSPSYEALVRSLSETLNANGYRLSSDPSASRLFITVSCGVTRVPTERRPVENRQSTALGDEAASEPDDTKKQEILWRRTVMKQIEDLQDQSIDATNADILGFSPDLDSKDLPPAERERLVHELSVDRLFVVIRAYDAAAGARAGTRTPVWEAHLSVPLSGNDLEHAFPLMAFSAGPLLGKSSGHVIHVRMGEAVP